MKNFTLAIALLICFSVQSQIGIGIPNPDQSAVLELASTQKGFLPPRLTTAERDAIAQPAEGLTIYNITKNCLEWHIGSGWFNACGDNGVATITNYFCTTLETGTMMEGTPVSGVSQTITATVTTIGSYDISATANGVTFSARGNFTSIGNHDIILHANGTPIAAGDHYFTLNTSPNSCSFTRTIDYSTVVSQTGKIWMAFNLGATAPATSATDTAQYGDLYQWGRNTDGHEKINSSRIVSLSTGDTPGHGDFIATTTTNNWRSTANTNLWQGVNGINNPCPIGYRVPTIAEWDLEFNTYGIVDDVTAYQSILKLTTAGYRRPDNGYHIPNTSGHYWSSTASGNNVAFKRFTSQQQDTRDYDAQSNGFSVRCIKD